ncbi:divergent polysaccharide deacetylase family protein [Blastochloris sulfoviridis]|uniref:Divergent polysaccharide deacetylase family protein n=1 Tax=Blastochloris sulfoviridis TaxID=50712 RepID=A0A5M6HME0_9HYPH|nr:divergent polysaccharide deacetylase family protein [Blastochloris sulfoviridis]KAA5596779.1 divergent polysaccharide deacetylase family protein [Blastochloris sulfoviridis]
MSVDDLQRPLGTAQGAPKRSIGAHLRALGTSLGRIGPAPVIAAAAGLVVGTAVGWVLLVDDPLGGEPIARVRIEGTAPAGPPPAGAPAAAPAAPQASTSTGTGETANATADRSPSEAAPATPQGPSVTVIDGRSGKTNDVSVAGPGDRLAPAPDPRLVEKARHGAVPRIGADGTRAFEAYARPAPAIGPGKAAMPRIAIVVGGLGISANGTSEAVAKLPPEVTLAFAPYGTDLDRVVARARTQGHEVLLQVPMEPFDYPDNDPGPQTLLTTLTSDQNIDRLHWFLARFPGFIGVASYMGARFTSSESALAPVMREITKRGLMFLDDGSSQRSVTREIAGGLGATFARADVVLDAVASPVAIDNALMRLERIAGERGSALGFATALPVSIDRVARWAKEVETRGYLLVPLSATVARGKKGA